MENYIFSFDNYRIILSAIKQAGSLLDYSDISVNTQQFIILRHDVEFSPKRALSLAEVESSMDISSTYFFQTTNNSYNMLSAPNIERAKRIISLGHHVGLHFHLHGSDNIEEIKQRIVYECDMLSYAIGTKVDRFSFHRPSQLVLEKPIRISELINAYDPLYFSYTNDISSVDFTQNVKYVADSRNEWSYLAPYSAPCQEFFSKYPKVQLLCHPYSWSSKGYDVLNNLKSIIDENRAEFIDTLNNETKYVKEYINEL